MLLECSKCGSRREVGDDIVKFDELCTCGGTFSAAVDEQNIYSGTDAKDKVQCQMCKRCYDPTRYRNGTLVACSCGNLLVMLNPQTKEVSIGRRNSDVKLRQLQRKLEVLTDASSLIGKIREIDRLILFSIRLIDEMLESSSTLIALKEKPWNTLLVHSLSANTTKLKRVHLGQGLIGICAREQKVIYVSDARHDPRYVAEIDVAVDDKNTAIICVPLLAAGECIGAIEVLQQKGNQRFTFEDTLHARLAAALIGSAIQYVRRNTEAEMLAEKMVALNSGFNSLIQQMRHLVAKLGMALVQINFKLGDKGNKALNEFNVFEDCIRQLEELTKTSINPK